MTNFADILNILGIIGSIVFILLVIVNCILRKGLDLIYFAANALLYTFLITSIILVCAIINEYLSEIVFIICLFIGDFILAMSLTRDDEND